MIEKDWIFFQLLKAKNNETLKKVKKYNKYIYIYISCYSLDNETEKYDEEYSQSAHNLLIALSQMKGHQLV